jgi:hypothetical protein
MSVRMGDVMNWEKSSEKMEVCTDGKDEYRNGREEQGRQGLE